MQTLNTSLLDEFDTALRSEFCARSFAVLGSVLFLNINDRLNEEQIGLFDDVLCHLFEKVEARTLAIVSVTLAPLTNAPRK